MQSKLKSCWIGLGAVVVLLGRSTGRRNWRAWRGSSLWGQEDAAEPGQMQRGGTVGGGEGQEAGAGDDGRANKQKAQRQR
jgi:hypothetical protein